MPVEEAEIFGREVMPLLRETLPLTIEDLDRPLDAAAS